MSEESEQLASGKSVIRHFNDEGRITSEMHSYGMLDISLSRTYYEDGSIEEMYLAKRRLISRARYEKLRVDYPDMPPADASLNDLSGELVKGAAAEQRGRKKAAAVHVADPKQAAQRDQFCAELMRRGRCEDASAWIGDREHLLGERSHAASRKLVTKLLELGCTTIHACEIQVEDEGFEHTSHLVTELPRDAEARKRVFRYLGGVAGGQGYAADFDDGQRYAYVNVG